jgi:hypothetical protein
MRIAMREILLPVFFFMLFGFVPQGKDISSFKHRRMDAFLWLEGNWETQRKAGIMEESWRVVDDSSMAGRSTLHKPDGSSQIFENIELAYRDGAYHYIVVSPTENGGEHVSFQISSFTDSGFTAENPKHDFPKRIVYRHISRDSILATIDGGPGQPGERVRFPFSRKKQ